MLRKNEKKKILELVDSIREGIEFRMLNKSQISADVINDCIYSLKYILSKFDNDINIINIINSILIELNDVIYKSDSNIIKSIQLVDELKEYITNIETKLEIVFMPYKASMWDSFDSVWQAAQNDLSCDCYVVPVPYYERDMHGKRTKLFYEGYDFPDEVTITPYELYDIKSRKPDIIYIHNPYDYKNKITVIDSRYYSEELAEYTDMLVYIPYYIDGSYKSVEEHNAYALQEGPLNATRIIAQSDTHRDLFLECGFEENKVLNLGSPKFDAAINLCNKNIDIPTKWKSICKDKKVFFLNTTIDDVLNNDDWIEVIKHIIEYFKNNKSVALIWRTHPLLDVTLSSMRPQYLNEYELLKNNILLQENIIKDESKDIYKIIKFSDALISGYSSIMFQYLITGKPVLSILNDDKLDDNRIYCVDYLGVYSITNGTTISDFVDIVLKSQDIKKEERMNRLYSSITNGDGSCGYKIHNYIKSEVINSNI